MTHQNFYLQLFGLLGFVVLAPIVQDYGDVNGPAVAALGASLLIVAVAGSFTRQHARFLLVALLAAVGVLSAAATLVWESELLPVALALALVAFVALSGVYAIRDVLLSGLVGTNELVGTVCIYIHIAVFWALVYYLLELWSPGTFLNLSAPQPHLLEFVYFSFVTLTTLGYGDVVPVGGAVRALTYSEACIGQFYLAILVAGLVGARLARISQSPAEP